MTNYKEEFIKEFISKMINHLKNKEKNRIISLGKGECALIMYLSEKGNGASPKELALFLNVGSGRIGNALKSLEEKDYVNRKEDIEDKRKTTVILTEKGLNFANERKLEIYKKISRMYDILGEDDSKELMRIINKLNNI